MKKIATVCLIITALSALPANASGEPGPCRVVWGSCPQIADGPAIVGWAPERAPTLIERPANEGDASTVAGFIHEENLASVADTSGGLLSQESARCRDGSVEMLTCIAAIIYILSELAN